MWGWCSLWARNSSRRWAKLRELAFRCRHCVFQAPWQLPSRHRGGQEGASSDRWRVTMRCLRESGPEAIPEADQGSGRATCLLDVHLVESEPAEVTLTPLSCSSYPASAAARVKTIPLHLGIVWNSIKKKIIRHKWGLMVQHGELCSVRWQPGWEGSSGRMDTCICMLSLKRSQSC